MLGMKNSIRFGVLEDPLDSFWTLEGMNPLNRQSGVMSVCAGLFSVTDFPGEESQYEHIAKANIAMVGDVSHWVELQNVVGGIEAIWSL